jgi:hypothetical protein
VATGDRGCEAYTAIAQGMGLSHERSDIAGAESFYSLDGNMCGTVTRGADALPGSKATSRAKGSHRKLGDLVFGRQRCVRGTVRIEMRRRMHQPIPDQGKWLGRVVRGYFNYHAVPTNGRSLGAFRHHVTDLWRRTLRRRSQKDRMTWARMTQLVDAWLPKPTILQPWPSDRFAVRHPRWEPYAGKPPVRFCAGGVR